MKVLTRSYYILKQNNLLTNLLKYIQKKTKRNLHVEALSPRNIRQTIKAFSKLLNIQYHGGITRSQVSHNLNSIAVLVTLCHWRAVSQAGMVDEFLNFIVTYSHKVDTLLSEIR